MEPPVGLKICISIESGFHKIDLQPDEILIHKDKSTTPSPKINQDQSDAQEYIVHMFITLEPKIDELQKINDAKKYVDELINQVEKMMEQKFSVTPVQVKELL